MNLNKSHNRFLQFFIFIIYFTSVISLSHAQTFKQDLHIEYKNNLITLSAQNVDLKNVLLNLANKTGVSVRFPKSLKKKITIKISGHPLNKTLSRILKGINHAIIYSGSINNRTVVSEVLVYGKSRKSIISSRSRPGDKKIMSRIRYYERRLKSLKEKMSSGKVSRLQSKRYSKQIRSYENIIEKLKKRIP